MTNATKTLAIIFAGTVVLALATSWGWSSSSSAAFQEELLAVETAQVQSIQIDRPEATSIRLHREADEWMVTPGDASTEYPASSEVVDRLLSTLPSLTVSAVATRQPEKHARYGVDSTATTVTLLGADEEPLGRLLIGRTQMQQPQSGGPQQQPMQRRNQGTLITYVRSPDRPDVYSVEASLRSLITQDVSEWRDKQLWAIDRSQIRRIEFEYPADSSFTITRAAPGGDSDTTQIAPDTWLSEGDTLATTSVSSLLRTLSSPQASGFVEDLSPDTFGEALHTIHVHLADDTRRTLRLRPGETDHAYTATASSFPYVVQVNANHWDQNVLLGRSEFLTEEDVGSRSMPQPSSF